MTAILASLSPVRRRTIDVALELFARNGVGGTSLQMIADELGVTKAAVYHQFRTKDDIVVVAGEAELSRLIGVLDAAEAERSLRRQREVLLEGMVDLAVNGRGTVGSILQDPAVTSYFEHQEMFRDVMSRLRRIVVGDDHSMEARVRPAMLVAAISGAVLHAFVADVDDETLRQELFRFGRRFLGLPG